MHKLKIVSYNQEHDYHVCIDERGIRKNIDLYTDRKLGIKPEELIGREIEVEGLYPYLEIAIGVRFP